MQNSNSVKGYGYALVATLALSNVYIFSKAALNEVNLPQFGFYWFGLAIIWNLVFSYIFRQRNNPKKFTLFQIKNLVGVGLIEVVATIAIFAAIKMIPNPAIPALIRNIEPVLIVILAIIILKEKYNRLELFGVFLTIGGTIIISYNKNGSLESLFIPGAQFMLISSLFYAIRTIWSKKIIHHFSSWTLNLNKVIWLFLAASLAIPLTHTTVKVPQSAFYYMLVGSFIGPFLTSFAQFQSLKFIDASRATLVQSSTGFITLILSYFYFNKLPFTYQVAGGMVTIIGLAILTINRRRLNALRNFRKPIKK